MKRNYNVFHAKVSSELTGAYKKIDEAYYRGTKNNRLSHIEKKSSEVGEASPTEWQYQSFKSFSSVSSPSTFHQAATITSTIEYQKPVIQKKRMSLVQELNQALAEGENEFVKVIFASQTQKEDLKQEQTQVKSKNLLKLVCKFFTKPKKEIINQDFKFENKDVYTYK